MSNIIFDGSALLLYLSQAPGSNEVEEWLNRLTGDNEMQGFVSTLSIGEAYYMTMRRKNEQTAERALRAVLSLPLHTVHPETELAIEAAKLKATHAISYVDAFAAVLTIQQKGLLVTADPVFKELHGLPFFAVQYL